MNSQTSFNRSQLLQQFISNHLDQLSHQVKKASHQNYKANVFPDQQRYLNYLGQALRQGQLVAFPTQTVYGLGADATNQKALLKIYQTKKRPLTDPIIAHVLDYDKALPLINFRSENQKRIFKRLTDKFWPGPLTIITKANLDVLPLTITAQTGFVGVRSPKHPYARKLLEKAEKPIGAPSANLFSHVSPTSAVHVFNDFYDQEINIVNGTRCQYGIQSTVIKLQQGAIQVLRQGSLLTSKLESFVKQLLEQCGQIQVKVIKKVQDKNSNSGMQSPGQSLKHYAPYLPCFFTQSKDIKQSKQKQIKVGDKQVDFTKAALLVLQQQDCKVCNQFGYTIISNKKQAEQMELQEEDIFCNIEQKSKMRNLYYLLRKAENVDAQAILILWDEPHSGTIWDKIFRATQGSQAEII